MPLRRFPSLLLIGLLLTAACSDDSGGENQAPADAGADSPPMGAIEFRATPQVITKDWLTGQNVSIDGVKGIISVKLGANSGKLVVTLEPFDNRADRDQKLAQEQMSNNLVLGVSDASGGYQIKTGKLPGSSDGLGADITVELPPNFDAGLSVMQRQGNLTLESAASASSIAVTSLKGECKIKGGDSALSTDVKCDDGSVAVTLGVPQNATGGTLSAGNGNLVLTLPPAGTFIVQASAAGGVDATSNANCSVDGNTAEAKTISCGGATAGAPVYEVSSAGPNGQVFVTF